MTLSSDEIKRDGEGCEKRFHQLFTSLSLAAAFVNSEGTVTSTNDAMQEMLERSRRQLEGQTLIDLVHPEDVTLIADHLDEVYAGWTNGFMRELRLLSGNGSFIWCHVWGAIDRTQTTPRIVLVATDLTNNKKSQAMLHHLSYFDDLTGLPNRTLAKEHLLRQITEGQIKSLAVMLLDLDRFQLINDSWGHDHGDRILASIAERLSAFPNTMPCRLGGDEFLVIVPNCDRTEALRKAEEILEQISRPLGIGGREVEAGGTMGIAMWPEDAGTVTGLLRAADIAMNRGKQSDPGRFCFFTRLMDRNLRHQLNLETDLRHAITRKQLVMHFQPQVSCRSGGIVGAEALLRWHHPTLGMLSPVEFIPIAEVSGAIHRLGTWALVEACRFMSRIHDLGFPNFRIAVNLSPVMFQSRELLGTMKDVLAKEAGNAGCVEFEITEGTMMAIEENSATTLESLKALGVTIAIDDFGTGYSSLSYLKRFPIDVLKIDRSFVEDIGNDSSGHEIARLIIRMTHALNARVVAEGVETAAQLEFLTEEGCDEFQGYIFSPAVPAEELERMVVEGRTIEDVLSLKVIP